MGKPKFKKKKDRFDGLEAEFKDAIYSSKAEEIRKRVSDLACFEVTQKELLKKDPGVLQARQALADMVSPYREDLKAVRLKIEFCKQHLDTIGAPVSK